MAKLLKLRRGTTSQHSSFTGAEGEVTIDTTKDTAVVHDGSTAAGRPLAREDLNNVSASTIAAKVEAASNSNTFTDADHTKLNNIETAATADQTAAEIRSLVESASDSNVFTDADHTKLNNIETAATADQTASEILTAIKTVDGSGSGLDADLLDSYQASEFVTSAASDTLTGAQYTFNSSTDQKIIIQGSNNPYIHFREGSSDKAYIQWNSNGNFYLVIQESGEQLLLGSGSSGLKFVEGGSTRTVWHSGNDGSGSGLDADTTDGLHVNNSASNNTIVARTSSGYIFANYFNTTPNDISSGSITKICAESGNDGYIRHAGAAAVRTFLNVQDGANYITNTNQLTNGAGYITSSSLSSYMPKSGGEFTGDLITHNIRPDGNGSRALGTSSYRWSNIYTSDLSLSNEAYGGNDVDGSWGDWTIQEGKSDLFLKNNRSGKTFKFNLTEVS